MLYYIQIPSKVVKYDRHISYKFPNSRVLIWNNTDFGGYGCWISHAETRSLV